MRQHVLALVLVALAASFVASPALAQKFVEEDYWRLSIKPADGTKLDKVKLGGSLYYFWAFEVTNESKIPVNVDLQIYLLTDQLRAGVPPQQVRDWKGFKNFELPKFPVDEREVFDNTEKYHMHKRFYDRSIGQVVQYASRKYADKTGPLVHASEIGKLPPGASKRAVATFRNVDPETDYIGVVVKGLENRIKNVQDEMFMEDRIRVFCYYTPGAASRADVNPIFDRRRNMWQVLKRERIKYPMN